MASLPFSTFKQGTNEYEVKDTKAREDMTWKLVGNAVTGNTPIAIPNGAKELFVRVRLHIGNNYYLYTIYILTSLLMPMELFFRQGDYANSSENASVTLSATDSEIKLASANVNGQSVITNTSISLFYR